MLTPSRCRASESIRLCPAAPTMTSALLLRNTIQAIPAPWQRPEQPTSKRTPLTDPKNDWKSAGRTAEAGHEIANDVLEPERSSGTVLAGQ